ncbi:MAG TPA: amidohydrolase family protein [Candidatus Dormibacteraeota bacterium]|nr:amidohydrolase family protein [Candidatus Dormibacteraeota bacterium]
MCQPAGPGVGSALRRRSAFPTSGRNARHAGTRDGQPHDRDAFIRQRLRRPADRQCWPGRVAHSDQPARQRGLKGRSITTPSAAGTHGSKELLAAGVNVCLGHDSVMDLWYPLGKADPLQAAFTLAHSGQMSGFEEIRTLIDMITVNGAGALGLTDYGLEPGCGADLVLFDAPTESDAVRLMAPGGASRLHAVRICSLRHYIQITPTRELQLGTSTQWGVWAGLAVMLVFGGASIWAAVTATDPAVAWIFGGGAAFCIGVAFLGAYVFGRQSTMFVEDGNLVARTPFSVRRVAIAEVSRLEVRLKRTRGGIAYRELVVVDQTGISRASILADDFSDSRIAHFAKAAGLRFKVD